MAYQNSEVTEGLRAFVLQYLGKIHTAFPVVVAHDYWDEIKTAEGKVKAVLVARVNAYPKYTRKIYDSVTGEVREEPLELLLDVPVNWYRVGNILFRFRPKKDQIFMCVCSEKALDKLVKDHAQRHPEIDEVFRLDDATLMPFGVRMQDDPQVPGDLKEMEFVVAGCDEQNKGHSGVGVFGPEGDYETWIWGHNVRVKTPGTFEVRAASIGLPKKQYGTSPEHFILGGG